MIQLKIDLSSFKEALDEIKEELSEELVDVFKQRIKDGPWDKLKRNRRYFPKTGHILWPTGQNLLASMDSEIQGDTVKVGSDFIGAAVLHDGIPGVMPERQYLNPDHKEVYTKIEEVFKRHSS